MILIVSFWIREIFSQNPTKIPEGPEIRITAEELCQKLTGRKILFYNIKEEFFKRTSGFTQHFRECTVETVRSYGKKVIFQFDNNTLMIASLGMTGRFQYKEEKHCHITFSLEDESKFYFNDPRRFGGLDVIPADQEAKYLSDLGPDILQHALDDNWISNEKWTELYKPKLMRRKIFDILLDQSIIAGLGLYLVTDLLYHAGVHPLRLGNTITTEELDLIRIHAHKVVLSSYQQKGLTISDFISPDGSLGKYQAAIYGKYKDPNGHKIIHQKASNAKGARTVHFVLEIQK